MKVYVDKLPKGKDIRCEIDSMVLAIDMLDKDKSYLMIGDKEQDNNFRVEFCSDNEVLVNCVAKILEHLDDYTKQVRKEVCEEIFRDFNRKVDDEFGDNDTKYITLDVEDVNFYLKDLVERIGEDK